MCNKYLLEYLFPLDDSETFERVGFTQYRDLKATNFKLRTTQMFFEWEIMQAKEYQSFLAETRYEREVHLSYYSTLQDWIDFLEGLFCQYMAEATEPEKQIEGPLTFIELFKKESDYKVVMGILSEQGLVSKNSGIWIDKKKGAKSYLVGILKHLHNLGYYKNEVTNEDYKRICENSFQYKIGIDTVKKAAPEKILDLTFIPPPFT